MNWLNKFIIIFFIVPLVLVAKENQIFFECELNDNKQLILYKKYEDDNVIVKYEFHNSKQSIFIYPYDKTSAHFTYAEYFRYQVNYFRVFFQNKGYDYMIYRNFSNEIGENDLEAGIIVTKTNTEKDHDFPCIKVNIDNLVNIKNYIPKDTKERL